MTVFTIPGRPKAWQRASRNGRVTFDNPSTRAAKNAIKAIARPLFNAPIQGPIKLTVWATFEPAKSWSKKKIGEHIARYHTQKPDADNLAKLVADALNEVAFTDDSQVACIEVRKVWGWHAQTVVTVEALEWGSHHRGTVS